jgi:hypothetical protein
MYRWVLILHGTWRWVVVLGGLAAVGSALYGLWYRTGWQPIGALCGRLFGIAVDIQVLLGAALYFVFSPLTTPGLSAAGEGSAASDLNFFSTRHGVVMTLALVAVHLSAVWIRRGRDDASHQRRAALCYGLTWLLLCSAIPWWRPWLRL